MIDFTRIKQAADGRCSAAIAATTGIPVEHLTKGPTDWACDQCGGKSVFYPDSRDGGANSHGRVCCRNCTGAKPTSDIIDTVQRFGGHKNAAAAARAVCESLGLDPARFGIGVGDRAPEPYRGDVVAGVAKAKGVPVESLLSYGAKPTTRNGLPACAVDVYDMAGKPVGTFDMTLAPEDKGKFSRGTYGVFLPGRKPSPGERWVLVEGCKDAAALASLGYNAAGMPTSYLPFEFAPLFEDCDVVLAPDLDKAGFDGVQRSSAALHGIAARVEFARMPGEFKLTGGDDVRDAIQRFGAEAVRSAIEKTRLCNPVDQENYDEFGFRLLQSPVRRPLQQAVNVDLSSIQSIAVTLSDGQTITLQLSGTPACAKKNDSHKDEPAPPSEQPTSQQNSQVEAADAEPLQDGQPLETRTQGDDATCDVCGDAMVRSEITIGGWVNFDCQNCGHVRPVQVE
ncbi:toprim domain-containing protein [Roseiconus lacunae]|uniref:DNA primase n=1 Tax=Roseiconus lacunae TaxID=2605694 RepID=A0ABT7PMQ1_9BACT|nr:hypothetical protein [Roseiconus lacunae]MDM4017765.1 hypothetical protein [Roseiconus lacunae]